MWTGPVLLPTRIGREGARTLASCQGETTAHAVKKQEMNAKTLARQLTPSQQPGNLLEHCRRRSKIRCQPAAPATLQQDRLPSFAWRGGIWSRASESRGATRPGSRPGGRVITVNGCRACRACLECVCVCVCVCSAVPASLRTSPSSPVQPAHSV